MIRSEEEIPFTDNDNFIELVGSNFEEVVFDKTKDVLVVFCPRRYEKCN